MTAVGGGITAMLDVLGAPKDDERIVRALSAGPGFREQQPFVDPARGDALRVTIHDRADGFEYRFVDGLLDRVVVHAQAEAHWGPYPHPTELIDGLDIASADAERVRQVLGEPWQTGTGFLRYRIGTRVLHVSFLSERISRIVVMAEER